MDSEFVIKAVGKVTKEWGGDYGMNRTFNIKLEETGDEVIELNRKMNPDGTLVKAAPKEGDVIFGHIEDSKNPNFPTRKFKSASGGGGSKAARQESPEVQDSIHRSVALNDAALVYQGSGEATSTILQLADDFYSWLTKSDSSASAQPTSLKEAWDKTAKKDEDVVVDLDKDEEINLDDIPF